MNVIGDSLALPHSVERTRLEFHSLPYWAIKRSLDLLAAFLLLIFVVPLLLVVALAVFLESPGFVFIRQERMGLNGSTFRMLKFRTMVPDAWDHEKYLDPQQIVQWNQERKVDSDPRITPLGRFLRRTSLDELPQMINVLRGDMSLVGPRAITRAELENFGEDADLLLAVRPGITGAWQVGPRNTATFASGERQRIELNYVQHSSFGWDLKILCQTFVVMFLHPTGR